MQKGRWPFFRSSLIWASSAEVSIRKNDDGSIFNTDQKNLILDADFGPMDDPASLAAKLDNRAGIAGQGLFIGLTSEVIIAGRDGIRELKP